MARKPNILLIMTDQHAPHIAGFAGNPVVDTPALDWLASRSVRFDAAYCQSPLCVPSRTSFLTGKWPHHCSAWDNRSVLFAEHVTLPAWLAQHGYATAAIGKMHFRGPEQMHGWQFRPYGDLCDSTFPCHQPDPPATATENRWANHSVGRFPFAGPTIVPESLLVDNVVTTESIAWLAEFIDHYPGQPWFVCASYGRPHFPLTAPGRFFHKYHHSALQLPELPPGYPESLHPHDRFIVEDFRLMEHSPQTQRRALAAYYACIEFVDACIGRLLQDAHHLGALENTYILYTSDHGEMAGEHGLWWKRTYYEESSRVPLLIAGPGITGGREVACPVELLDLFPTFCGWAGIECPSQLDGESLAPLLCGDPEARQKQWVRSELLGGKRETRFRMVRDERWKLVDFPDAPMRLFDLADDPTEMTDLSSAIPMEANVASLQAKLAQTGTWDELDVRREVDQQRAGPLKTQVRSAAQYRLRDGRLVEADAFLYG